MQSRLATKTVTVLLALAAVVAVAGVVVVGPSVTKVKWVGHEDLDVQFLVTDEETGSPIRDATVHVRLEGDGGFYERGDKSEFDLVSDQQGEAHYVCKNSMCFGSQGAFEDTFAIHLPWWWIHASAPGHLDSEPFYLDVLERQRQVDRGDEQAKLVVRIALRKTRTNKS